MPDAKEGRERKGTGKRDQRLDWEIEEERQREEAPEKRRESHDEEEAERELGADE